MDFCSRILSYGEFVLVRQRGSKGIVLLDTVCDEKSNKFFFFCVEKISMCRLIGVDQVMRDEKIILRTENARQAEWEKVCVSTGLRNLLILYYYRRPWLLFISIQSSSQGLP